MEGYAMPDPPAARKWYSSKASSSYSQAPSRAALMAAAWARSDAAAALRMRSSSPDDLKSRISCTTEAGSTSVTTPRPVRARPDRLASSSPWMSAFMRSSRPGAKYTLSAPARSPGRTSFT